nr:hypothetical protein [uncultured Blautia sp.]
MKCIYYYVPAVFWLIGTLVFLKNVFLMVFIEIMQIAISTIVLVLLKNVGKKKQFYEAVGFLKQIGII